MTTLHQYTAKFALSLPETHCSQPFGEGCDVYKVMNKVFMLSFHLEGKAVINLKVIPDNGVMLRDIYPYIRTGWHMNKQHWISIYENEDLDSNLVIDLLQSSYDLVVSKLNKVQRQRIAALRAIT